MNGIIVKGIGGFYYVKAADSNVYECKARGIFRKNNITPTVGDRVEIDTDDGSIIEIKPRSSYLIRPAVANIDAMVIVVAAASPDPNLFLTDKMLVNAQISGIMPIICINKTDLASADGLLEIYSHYNPIALSAQAGEGTEKLVSLIKNKVTAFSGASGVGKSSILNLITDNEMETGAISEKNRRGRHTTRHTELLNLKDGGFVFDTPGFSSLEITGISHESLWEYFPEMKDKGNLCRFRGCVHIDEPDCAVKELLENGTLAPSRYESYKELYGALKQIKEWKKK